MMNVLEIIKGALWGGGPRSVTEEEYEELLQHTVAGLPAGILSGMEMPAELKAKWQRNIIQTISYFYHYCHVQDRLPVTVPYVILKGTSAAKYYPHPEYRAMGDIDIMTRREDFDTACDMLLANGFEEEKLEEQFERDRHREFRKEGISVEVHRFFAALYDPAGAKYLDDLIIAHIDDSHVLPDPVNGMVLLEHISQHLENGLGLRQIIDWMMFVHQCLPDEEWPAFQPMAQKTGLEKLAVTATRMCEIYLGLKERSWCAKADPKLCRQLMEYVMSCGNFGSKKTTAEDISENLLVKSASLRSACRLLQQRGLVNWEAAQRHAILRPFAGLYQLCRYIRRGLGRNRAASKLGQEYRLARERRILIKTLGARQESRGVALYRDGKYTRQ